MRKLCVTDVQDARRALRRESSRAEPGAAVLRLAAVLLIGAGHSCYEVADWLGVSPRSLERWVRSYQSQGAAGLRDARKAPARKRLTAVAEKSARQAMAMSPGDLGYDAPRWTGALLQHHLEERHGVRLGVRQCQRMLRAGHEATQERATATRPAATTALRQEGASRQP